MRKDPTIFLHHILDSIRIIQDYVSGMTFNEFEGLLQVQDAVIRRLEIIGEAVKHIPDDIRLLEPSIPWKEIAGLMDVLIHQYFGVDLKLTWRVVEFDLINLEKGIRNLLSALKT